MSEVMDAPAETVPTEYPPGEYAIVELMGHTTLIGRISEIERFGSKMLAIEPLFNDQFLPMVFRGGASIYALTPCSADIAFKKQARSEWQLPTAIRAIVPQAMLPAPAQEAELADPGDDTLLSDAEDEVC